jgi:hypothetical protein
VGEGTAGRIVAINLHDVILIAGAAVLSRNQSRLLRDCANCPCSISVRGRHNE